MTVTVAWTEAEAQQVVKEIVRRATTEADFRQMALNDPAKAVEVVAGKPLPAGVSVKVFDGEGATFSLVLPPLKADVSELSDQELEQVAGGRCGASCAVSCAATTTVGLGIPGVGGVACL